MRRGRARRGRGAPAGRRARIAALALVGLAVGLSACTGTREARTPVAVVVGGNDGAGGRIEWIASPLPPEPGGDGGEFVPLPAFARELPGTLVDLAVARETPVGLYALHRDGRDLLSRFEVGALDLDDPGSLPTTPVTIDLGRRVADAGVLPEPASLCAAGIVVSADGRWAGISHVPANCGDGADETSNVLLVELAPEAGEAPVVVPEAPSTDDAPGTPTFVVRDGEELLAWPLRGGDLVGLALDAPRDPRRDLGVTDALSDVLDASRGGLGLVAIDDGRAVSVPLGDGEPGRGWDAPAGTTFVAAVDASGLPGAVAIVRGEDELVVIPDVEAPAGEGEPGQADVPNARDAVVDPYGYVFVASDDRLAAIDVLSYLAAPDGRPSTVLSTSLEAPAEPRAVAWLFAPGGAPAPAGSR